MEGKSGAHSNRLQDKILQGLFFFKLQVINSTIRFVIFGSMFFRGWEQVVVGKGQSTFLI